MKLPGTQKTTRSVGLHLGFRCKKCEERIERKATAGERKFYATFVMRLENKAPHTHTVWHDFVKCFKTKDNVYRWIGYPLMERVEKWAEKYPGDVRVVGIDDSFFSTSDLVLVEHRTDRTYTGTTAVVIPQCSGEAPIEFFLYPRHRTGLLGALLSIARAARPIVKLEREDRVKRNRAVSKNLRHPAVI